MNVVWTAAAQIDLASIGDHIARDNPRRAARFVSDLLDRGDDLGTMPLRFPVVPRFEQHGIRRRAFGRYLIFYWVRNDVVEILHVLHGARDYARLLDIEVHGDD